jgi:hypothetical protein
MKKPVSARKPVAAHSPEWNSLTSPWMEAVTLRGKTSRGSPLDAVANANKIHRIVSENPLDVFAAHRFLLTLIYWVAGDTKSVALIRKKLLGGQVPSLLVKRLKAAEGQFNLFDRKAPFMQAARVRDEKTLAASSLFAELATGTNVAHFHHGDDERSKLCVRCTTVGLIRLPVWTQYGGRSKFGGILGAPPMLPIAIGKTLCETLGLNLIPMNGPYGRAQWSGQFTPSVKRPRVALLEGLTWNPRVVFLHLHPAIDRCDYCGETGVSGVGPIVFRGNQKCGVPEKYQATWRDPAAFYRLKNGVPQSVVLSGDESIAAVGGDVRNLFQRTFGKKVQLAPSSLVVEANPAHKQWYVVVPCTNPANNKSFDHRAVWLNGFSGDPPSVKRGWPKEVPIELGLRSPQAIRVAPTPGAIAFVRAAASLTAADWSVVDGARSMEDDPAAFDLFTAVYWPLRNKHSSLPSRPAAWLAMKLMACAGRLRPKGRSTAKAFQPWTELDRHQTGREGAKRYPRSIPTGNQLETELRRVIGRCVSSKSAGAIDWPGMCQFLHDVLA